MANNKNITFDQLQASLTVVRDELSKKADTVHTSTTGTYGMSSAMEYGHAKASSTIPLIAGSAAVGFETFSFARGDHVHPEQVNITGNAGTADKLKTATSFTIGSTEKEYDGSSSVSWTLDEIGSASAESVERATDTEVENMINSILGNSSGSSSGSIATDEEVNDSVNSIFGGATVNPGTSVSYATIEEVRSVTEDILNSEE